MLENPEFGVRNSMLYIAIPEIQVLPVWAAILLFPVVGHRRVTWGHFI